VSTRTPQSSSLISAYIGVGSNLHDPMAQVTQAITALSALTMGAFKASSLYFSPPMGPADQPNYVNAVVLLETDLPAIDLLDSLQAIENRQGRVRGERWGARTLDLDLLLYAGSEISSERLTVPHPGISKRDFVLLPLKEIAADILVPGLGTLDSLIERCPLQGARKNLS